MANASVSSRLDYCNSLIRGSLQVQCMQKKEMHWVAVEHRSLFKTAILGYKFLHTGFAKYLSPYLYSCSSFTVPDTVRVVVISLFFHSYNLLLISEVCEVFSLQL